MLRVIFNVLVNAFDAVNGEGQVTVRREHDGSHAYVRLVLEDDGPGLDPAYAANDLFRPFRSTKPDGLGLGLYQAKHIVESHGGTLAVTSREDRPGTQVTIVPPAAPQPVRQAWSAMAEQGAHATS